MHDALGTLAKIHYGKSPNAVTSIDGSIPVVGTGGTYGWANQAVFHTGVVVARKGSLGKPHLCRSPFWPADTTYAVIPHANVDLDWLYYCLLNFDLTKLNEATGVPSISRDWLAKTRFFNPGYEKQKKIAAFLAGIDTAIEKTEALIAKYQQIKAGLMHDLFTRGVLPNGQLRPTRKQAPELYQETVIGWIPADWKVCPLDQKVNPARPIVYGILMPGYGHPGGVPVVKVKDIRNRSINMEGLLLTSPAIDQEYKRSRLKEGDVLFTIRGTVGRVAIVPEQLAHANITQDTARIDLLGVHGKFISFYFETAPARRFFEVNTLGVAVQGINLGELRKLPIPVPALDEQARISDRLVVALERIDAEIRTQAKLVSQKLGLMQDLLTGKVQVKVDAQEPAHA
jgi:type I restriction enzyme S subunit